MSTLTKIFIVLMVIFSIAFTMSSVNFAAKTNDWRRLAEAYRSQQQVAETQMRQLTAAHAADKTIWIDAKNSLNDRIAELDQTVSRQIAEIADLRDDVGRLKAEKSGSEALAQQLASELKVAHGGWLEQRDQRKQIEQRNMELERRNLDLSERVNEQTAQILVLVQQQQQLEQQLNIMKEENRKLTRSGQPGTVVQPVSRTGMHGVSAVSPPAATPIRGRILDVKGNLASISVGSADGVREGMTFVVYRGSQYVADIEITDVDPNESAGRIMSAGLLPRPDDMVTDELALGLAR